MVEGPGCKLKGQKMKGKILGQTVKSISGNAIENRPKRDLEKPTPFHNLINRKIIDVKTLGKELFIFFCSGECLRVHFLMAGFVRYNGASEDPDEGAKKKTPEKPRLQLSLDKDVVSMYQCSTEMRNSEETEKRWNNMIELDICWRQFNHERATKEILDPRNNERLICDVILDQEILPGVGNIIKNEALFDAGINPLTKVKDLTHAHASRLVKMNRDFSMIFYDCRKNGKPLSKFYKMYRFSKCKQCEGKVTKCKPGEYERGTYFCAVCQDNSMKAGPSKNSLIGWTTGSKPKMAKTEAASGSVKVLAEKNEVNSNGKDKGGEKEMCKGHKKACVMKTVAKVGENKGRAFWSCSMPRGKSCDHFSWADLHHPKCKHGSITIKREVYKQNQNNGRSFYICPKNPKAKQCDFFMWADEQGK